MLSLYHQEELTAHLTHVSRWPITSDDEDNPQTVHTKNRKYLHLHKTEVYSLEDNLS